MYKNASRQTGGCKVTPIRIHVDRKKQHGKVRILFHNGVLLDPPIELNGDTSIERECPLCRQYFGLNFDTPLVVVGAKVFAFCCDDHSDKWIADRVEQAKAFEQFLKDKSSCDPIDAIS